MSMDEVRSAFLQDVLSHAQRDPRLLGVAVGGSWLHSAMDEYSDLDLVLVVEPEHVEQITHERLTLAESFGALLAAFTGDHVGEPRLLICLYGPPLLHVDLKFVALPDLGYRVDDPVVLWERDGRVTAVLTTTTALYPTPDLQWIEDRFWVWLHYGATKLGRGELFEVLDMLAYVRGRVLGPLLALRHGFMPNGTRRLEMLAPSEVPALEATLGAHDRSACADALMHAANMYSALRDELASPDLERRMNAERASRAYLADIAAGNESHRSPTSAHD
ncbi:MAG TPA: aminoglycoside 6-adenylyltransferase [Ktedonobacterales bacterium]|nr:aminoglycoside 6-adenylyltransferase [Ktedonobacterales bacterium]